MNEFADHSRNDMSLLALMRFFLRNKGIIAICTVVCIIGAVAIAFTLQPKYRAEIVVSPADGSSGLGELGGQLGGLASLAGISLGGTGNRKAEEALEFLRSRAFTAGFIQRHALLPVLFAAQWDASRQQWRDPRDVPTIAQGVRKFSKDIRQIAEDKRTGIVTLSIVWWDRVAAADWANSLIAEADKELRDRAIAEQNRSVEYLKSEAMQTPTVEIGNAISKLMETELKNAMVARTRDAYAFKVIDPAVAPDAKDRYSPNKPLIAVLGLLLGVILGVVIAAIRER